MEADQQRVREYVNYALALAGLALVLGLSRQRRLTRRNTFQAQLEARGRSWKSRSPSMRSTRTTHGKPSRMLKRWFVAIASRPAVHKGWRPFDASEIPLP
ncbi:MAG: hypothetical protein OXL38_11950 [Gammaproteobacteria bacterium]|nr:hypothetical protein [Gammaproteobacteria bacterium]